MTGDERIPGDTSLHAGQHKETFRQLVFFTGIGAVGTTGHYLTLISLVEFAGLNPGLATTAGFVVGALINYILNYRFTFRSSKRHRDALAKFLIIALVGALLNYGIMVSGTKYTQIHYLIIQLVATALVLLWNFLLNKFWTFSDPESNLDDIED